jgi:UDP-glucose 4-epimerase
MSITLPFKRVFITGGAGFIGSHLIDRLCRANVEIVGYDNLSCGTIENIEQWLRNRKFSFVHEDLLKSEKVLSSSISGCDTIFHLAADPEVRIGSQNPKIHYEQNVTATFNLLEAVRRIDVIENFVFTSSSTVYGEPKDIPTPEDYAPLKPISVYGASKLASESLIISYAYTYGFNAMIYRLANIVGSRMKRGVILDFLKKLTRNPRELEILGDGTQTKSYLDVEECIDAMLLGAIKHDNNAEIYNVGSEDQVNVKEIADVICEEMNLKRVKYVFTGGTDGGRGWKGDVKVMLLNIERLQKIGWTPKLSSLQAVRKTVKSLGHQEKNRF